MALRIGIFSSSLPEPGRKPGGVDVLVHRLANKLADRGHRTTVYSYSLPPADAQYRSVRLSPAACADARLARLIAVPLLLNRLDTSELDVLHLHGDDWFFVNRRVPTVRTFHGSALHEARTATGFLRRVSQSTTFALEIVASRLSTSSYTVGPNQGQPYAPDGYLSNGVDVPKHVPMTRPDPPSVLFVGTWEGRKRGRLLHETFHRDVLPKLPSAQLHMVSDHCIEGPNVHWWDRPSDAELRDLYQRAWVFCLPSSYEGFGMPYAEAMALGTPAVATPNPGAFNVLDEGRAGVIVGTDRLGETILRILIDRALRARLAEAGRDHVRQFSWTSVVDAHEVAYEHAIDLWRRGASSAGRRKAPG